MSITLTLLNHTDMKDLYKQCHLQSGNHVLTAWLESSKIKVGDRVTLKDSDDPKLWWTVKSIGDIAMPKGDIKGAHGSCIWFKNDYRRPLKGLNIKS